MVVENITVGQIVSFLAWIVAIGGSVSYITSMIRKAIDNGFKPILKKIDNVDKNATMNFLVRSISDMDKGNKLDNVNRMRFIEQYDHYIELGGNSYIKKEVERLEKEGKI